MKVTIKKASEEVSLESILLREYFLYSGEVYMLIFWDYGHVAPYAICNNIEKGTDTTIDARALVTKLKPIEIIFQA